MKRASYVMLLAFAFTVGACAESRPAWHATEAATPRSNAEAKPKSARQADERARRHVDDLSGKVTAEERSSLIAKLEGASTDPNVQLGAIIVPTLNSDTIEQLGERTFKAWVLGERGILLVIAIHERQARIETGRGIEAIVPDDLAHVVLLRHRNPHLRAEDFYAGSTRPSVPFRLFS